MLNSDIVKKLYEGIRDSFESCDNTIWKDILEVISEEKDKNPNEECVSLKKAIRMYLEVSADYNDVWFTRICEVQEEIERCYDGLVFEFIKEKSSLPEKRIEKMMKDLKIHFDLYSEIVEYLMNGNNYIKKMIEVEGYNAKELSDNYKLSIVGAYNYLIYLREDSVSALADLKAGLPRR